MGLLVSVRRAAPVAAHVWFEESPPNPKRTSHHERLHTTTGRTTPTIGAVILPDGTNVKHTLVKDGWCWWYRKYAPGDSVLEGLEKDARTAKKGLWVEPNPVPPWEVAEEEQVSLPLPRRYRTIARRKKKTLGSGNNCKRV